MLENIAIVVIVIVVLAFVFCCGYVLGAFFEYPEIETNQQDIHCFQCEIETPAKEKNGKLYCSNCGLIHLNEY